MESTAAPPEASNDGFNAASGSRVIEARRNVTVPESDARSAMCSMKIRMDPLTGPAADAAP